MEQKRNFEDKLMQNDRKLSPPTDLAAQAIDPTKPIVDFRPINKAGP
jgi:hypothetical protein